MDQQNYKQPTNELEFVDNLWKLKKKIERTLGYHVSLKLLLNDEKYRQSVISKALKDKDLELKSLAQKTEQLIKDNAITLKQNSYSTEDVARLKEKAAGNIAQQQPEYPRNKSKWVLTTSLVVGVVIAIAVVGWHFLSKENQSLANQQEVNPLALQKTIKEQAAQQVETLINYEQLFSLVGSNTVGEKLAPALVKAYMKESYPDTKLKIKEQTEFERLMTFGDGSESYQVNLSAHGSSSAFKGLKNSTSVIGMASRKVKDKEISDLRTSVGDLSQAGNEHIIGMDGLAIIVHPSNPVNALTVREISSLFSGGINNWKQLGGKDWPVSIYARANGSGTLDTFQSLVMKPNVKNIKSTALRFESSSELSDKVSNDVGAIGFIGLPYVRHSKSLAVAQSENSLAIKPTAFTISTEDYPLSRRLYFYTKQNEASIKVKDFVKFVLSVKGQTVVEEMGLISQNIREQRVKASDNSPGAYQFISDSAWRLSLNFRFKSGSNELDNKSKRDIERLVDYLQAHSDKQISLIGFSDSIGEAGINQAISVKRAQEVERELSRYGVPVSQTLGFGEALPLASNMTEFGRKKNRRVEVWVNI